MRLYLRVIHIRFFLDANHPLDARLFLGIGVVEKREVACEYIV
jgi:hypothetical protein